MNRAEFPPGKRIVRIIDEATGDKSHRCCGRSPDGLLSSATRSLMARSQCARAVYDQGGDGGVGSAASRASRCLVAFSSMMLCLQDPRSSRFRPGRRDPRLFESSVPRRALRSDALRHWDARDLHCPSHLVSGYENQWASGWRAPPQTTRKPRSRFRPRGRFLRREAERRRLGSSSQELPRTTRSPPRASP